jgi:hypothetical protein
MLLAVLAFGLSMLWTAFVVFANSMSAAPGVPFKGAWTLGACWLVTAGLFLWSGATW